MVVAASLALLSLVGLPSALAGGLYPKSSAVLSIDGASYQSLIADSNHTSILEFYAPWCGHCKNLQPEYEKAAQKLKGLAKVAAINCDEEINKPFCGRMGVQGFPTLKIVKQGKKPGKPMVEDYQGERTAKAIIAAVLDKVPNKVKRLKDADYSNWLEQSDKPKAILFSDKGVVSALFKAVAIDFLGGIEFAQIRDKETQAVKTFAVDKFPTLVLIPSGGASPVNYEGKIDKALIVDFLSQAASPNPDPAPKAKKSKDNKKDTKKEKSSASKASSSFSKASQADRASKSQAAKASQTSETLEDLGEPTESPSPQVDAKKPIKLPDVATPIASLAEKAALQRKCLNNKAGHCILVLLPETSSESSTQAVTGLSEVHAKYERSKHVLFPFFQLPSTNPLTNVIRGELALSAESVQIVAVNAKRGWFALYPDSSFSRVKLEEWVDAIRMGDLKKTPLPDGLVVDEAEVPAETAPADMPESVEDLKAFLREKLGDEIDLDKEFFSGEDAERLLKEAAKKAKAGGEGGHDEL